MAAYPPGSGLANFEWRVSMAEVRAHGAFSIFPDIDRSLAVLEGSLRLLIADRPPTTLSPETPPVHFPGDVAASARPLGGVVTDLNVMVRRGRWRARMSLSAVERFAMPAGQGSALLIALTPLTMRSGAGAEQLARLDAALLEAPAACEVQRATAAGALWLIELTSCTQP